MPGRWGHSGYGVVGAGGGGGGVASAVKMIRFSFTSVGGTSATDVPAGAVISQVVVRITQAWGVGVTLSVTCGAQTVLAAAYIDAQTIELYVDFPDLVIAATSPIVVTPSGVSVSGIGSVEVLYATPSA